MSAAVTKQVEINGTTYRLIFKFGTMRIAGLEIGRPIEEWGGDFDVLSSIFWATLQPHHKLTREGADNLVDYIGIKALAELIGGGVKEFMAAQDRGTASKPDDDEGNAPKAKKGKT